MENPNLEKALERLQAAFGQLCNPNYTPPPDTRLTNLAYTPPPDIGLANLVPHPAIVLIIGHRDAGKTALANRLQELKRDVAPPYAVALPAKAAWAWPDAGKLESSVCCTRRRSHLPEDCQCYRDPG